MLAVSANSCPGDAFLCPRKQLEGFQPEVCRTVEEYRPFNGGAQCFNPQCSSSLTRASLFQIIGPESRIGLATLASVH